MPPAAEAGAQYGSCQTPSVQDPHHAMVPFSAPNAGGAEKPQLFLLKGLASTSSLL